MARLFLRVGAPPQCGAVPGRVHEAGAIHPGDRADAGRLHGRHLPHDEGVYRAEVLLLKCQQLMGSPVCRVPDA